MTPLTMRSILRSASASASATARVALTAALLVLACGCNKDNAKPEESKKSEAAPVPSDMVFNDFLPTTGAATGLGVRDAGLEGGLAAIAAAAGEPGADQARPGAADAPPGDTAKLRVTEPGAEPRAPRKYSFVANRVDKRVLTITQSVSQSMGGQTSPAQELTLKLSLDLTPKQIKPAGQGAVFEAKITKVDLPGAPPQAAAMLSSVTGLVGTFDVTSHGEVGEVSFSATQQMKNQLAETVVQALSQAVQLLLAPFPDAPVGVGAKWELGSRPGEPDQGVKRFTLKDVSPDSAVVEAAIEIKVPKRQQPGPRGSMMTVEADGKGKYTYQSRFDHVSTRVEGELTLNEKIEAGDPKGGGKQSVVQSQKAKHLLETPK